MRWFRRGAAKALETLGQGDADSAVGIKRPKQGVRRGFQQLKNVCWRRSHRAKWRMRFNTVRLALKATTVQSSWLSPVLTGGRLLFSFLSGGSSGGGTGLKLRGNVASLDIAGDGSQLVVGRTMGVVEIWDITSKDAH